MSQVAYQIKIKDTGGNDVALYVGRGRYSPATSAIRQGGLVAFSYWSRLRTAGSFTLWIDGTDSRISQFVQDGQIEIERRDITAGGAFTKVYEGLIRMFEYIEQTDGTLRFIVRGRGYNDLLASEPIFYDVGSAQALKNGAAETVAKSYVDQNIGPNAGLDANGNTRVRPGLTVEGDAATGDTWTGDRAYSNLLDVLIEIAEFTGADFGIVGTGAAAYEFRWRDGQWGADKRQGTADQVIFSSRRRNVQEVHYYLSHLDEATTAYIIGGGAGDIRVSRVRSNAAALAASPLARRAVVRDASDEVSNAALDAFGDRVLQELSARPTLTFSVLQAPGTRYVRDWDIGDLVTVEYNKGGTFDSVDQKIIGVRVALNENGDETISAETDYIT